MARQLYKCWTLVCMLHHAGCGGRSYGLQSVKVLSVVSVVVMPLQAMIEDDALIALTAHHWCWGADNSGDVRRPENIRFIWEEAKVSLDRCMKHSAVSGVVHTQAAKLCILKQQCNHLCGPLATDIINTAAAMQLFGRTLMLMHS